MAPQSHRLAYIFDYTFIEYANIDALKYVKAPGSSVEQRGYGGTGRQTGSFSEPSVYSVSSPLCIAHVPQKMSLIIRPGRLAAPVAEAPRGQLRTWYAGGMKLLDYVHANTDVFEHASVLGEKLSETPLVQRSADQGPNFTEYHEISAVGGSFLMDGS